MHYFVAFDGSPLSAAALRRVRRLGQEGEITVGTAVPKGNTRYARERGWLAEGEPFDSGTVARRIESEVRDIAPDAAFGTRLVGKRAPPGRIATELREMARAVEPDLIAVGSENAGRVVAGISSVASSVTAADDYDVLIVRRVRE